MNYNFELSRFLDNLRKKYRITYEDYTNYRGMADTLGMENDRLEKLEDKIKSGELCNREEVRKETAKEILILLGKGFEETARKDFKDLQWYKQFCRELELRYGIDLFGKTEQVENFDKLEQEE